MTGLLVKSVSWVGDDVIIFQFVGPDKDDNPETSAPAVLATTEAPPAIA